MKKLHVFAEITIGSFETTLSVYQVTPAGEMTLLNKVKEKIEVGKDTIRNGRISNAMTRKLCKKVAKLKQISAEYGADEVLLYGATAIREAANQGFVLDQIKMSTGLVCQVLTNPQQSFYVYKGVVSNPKFEELAEDGAVILDASPGKLRVSIFSNGELLLTQNIALGAMVVREWVQDTGFSQEEQAEVIRELISHRFKELESIFMSDLKLKTMIIAGDLFLTQNSWKSKKGDLLNEDKFMKLCKKAEKHLSQNMALTEDADILLPSVIICEEFFKRIGAKQAWISGIAMNDGIAYDHVINDGYVTSVRDFDKDIMSEVTKIMNRYIAATEHNIYCDKISNILLKGLAKTSGLTKRDEMILKISSLLHNVGTYISMEDSIRISSYVVKKSEIVGISSRERDIIGEVIRCHKCGYDDFLEYIDETHFTQKEKILIGKLAVLLGIANTLDTAHCQKFDTIRVAIKNDEFRITVNSLSDGVLEKGFIELHSEFFEAMFGYKLVLREKNQRFTTL